MGNGRPMLFIGMPVYNGLPYFREALASMLAQTFGDFEVLISDNASTDGTYAAALEFAAADRRIRVQRHAQNIGASRNYMSVLSQARSPYYLALAHDDVHLPSFLAQTVENLERHPRALLSCTASRFIDEQGHPFAPPGQPEVLPSQHTVGLGIVDRVRNLISVMAWHEIHGVLRQDVLRGLSFAPVFGADLIALMDLFLLGECVSTQEPLLLYRVLKKDPEDFRNMLDASRPTERTPYTTLLHRLYERALRFGLPAGTLAEVRECFVTTIVHHNAMWRNVIFSELGYGHPGPPGEAEQRGVVERVLDGEA